MPAGYGAAEFEIRNDHQGATPTFPLEQLLSSARPDGPRAALTWAEAGIVEDDPEQETTYIGAAASTNNTGELTGLYWAIKRAEARPKGQGGTLIWTDSLYALNMTTGTWLPRKKRCRAIVSHLRCAWRDLQRARPGEVRLRHVRSHIKVPGNELADWLAEMRPGGKSEAERTRPGDADRLLQSSTQWLQKWFANPAQQCGTIPQAGRAGGADGVATTNRGPGSLGDATGEG